MKLVVGLGNPGREYAPTRHNLGFWVLDRLARTLRIRVARWAHGGLCGEGEVGGEKVALLKPQTFMNRSGLSVASAADRYALTPTDILVIHDDLDLELGRLRLRPQGGPGGHNGVRSVIESLGTEAFPRLRIGIGRPPEGWEAATFVLNPFEPEEKAIVDRTVALAAEAAETFLREGLEAAMNRYNAAG